MSDYYTHHFQAYHARTFGVDPSSFLNTLTTHLETGCTVTNSDDRQFYLWQDKDLRDVFQSQNLSVIDFFRQPSILETKDIWLGYVLKKA